MRDVHGERKILPLRDGVDGMNHPGLICNEEFLELLRVFAMSQSCLEDALTSAQFQQEVLNGKAEEEL